MLDQSNWASNKSADTQANLLLVRSQVVKNEDMMSGEKKIDTFIDQDDNSSDVDAKADKFSHSEVKQYRNNSNMMRIEERGDSMIDP